MKTVRILLVDDHEVVRMGLKALLSRHPKFKVIAEASSKAEAIAQAIKYEPEIVLMDIRLPDGSGIEACQQIVRQLPQTKVIILTSYAEDELLFGAIRAGAVSYVLKRVGSRDLIRAIEGAMRGEGTLDPSLTQRVFSEMRRSIQQEEAAVFDKLTDKEMHVLLLLSKGETNRTIAEHLHLSQGTIRNYVSNILSKLDLSNRAEAAVFATKHRLHEYLPE